MTLETLPVLGDEELKKVVGGYHDYGSRRYGRSRYGSGRYGRGRYGHGRYGYGRKRRRGFC